MVQLYNGPGPGHPRHSGAFAALGLPMTAQDRPKSFQDRHGGSGRHHDAPGRTPQTPQDAPAKRPRRPKRPPRRAKSRFWWSADLKMQPSSHQNHILKRCYLKIAWKQKMINFPIDFNDFSRFVNPFWETKSTKKHMKNDIQDSMPQFRSLWLKIASGTTWNRKWADMESEVSRPGIAGETTWNREWDDLESRVSRPGIWSPPLRKKKMMRVRTILRRTRNATKCLY